MQPRELRSADLDYWADQNPRPTVFVADGAEPCPGIVTDALADHPGAVVVRVPWKLDEIELVHLAKGGTLWLSTWGGLPPHQLEVQPPADPTVVR